MRNVVNVVFGVFLWLNVVFAQATTLENIRHSRLDNKIRLVLDMDSKAEFQYFSLTNPPRIVLDLPDTSKGNARDLTINQDSVIGVRVGYRQADLLRVVIDLRKSLKADVYTLAAEGSRGNRIVVDLYQDESPAPTRNVTKTNRAPIQLISIDDNSANFTTNISKNASVVDKRFTNIGSGIKGRSLSQSSIKITPPPTLEITAAAASHSTTFPVSASPMIKMGSTTSLATLSGPIASTANAKTKIVNSPVSTLSVRKPAINTSIPATLSRRRDIVVCIDPGHGGKDPGAQSKATRVFEKNVVLQIGKRLRSKLYAKKGYRVIMTRDKDNFIPLYQRPEMCRQSGGDLFVSIHADAVESSQPSGSSIYILSTRGASSQLAKYLANKENAVDLKWGVDVSRYDDDIQRALLNIQQEATLESSYALAKETLTELKKVGNVHKSNIERANFVVLRAPEIPSMLVETAFISNPSEARLLTQPKYQEKLATGIANGIERYFKEHASPQLFLHR